MLVLISLQIISNLQLGTPGTSGALTAVGAVNVCLLHQGPGTPGHRLPKLSHGQQETLGRSQGLCAQ